MPSNNYLLAEANYHQLLEDRPNIAVLPWGATEAHNYHMPHGSDTLEAESFARRSGELASTTGRESDRFARDSIRQQSTTARPSCHHQFHNLNGNCHPQ
ncbi:MAG: creatininase family protein [Phycisphaeraceae bacterium]|nr:creatininase family protein [Phycisphaeraceae bacterium]